MLCDLPKHLYTFALEMRNNSLHSTYSKKCNMMRCMMDLWYERA